MDPDEDPFVASRVSLQSRRERLAKRNEQSTQETQRFLPSDDNHNAEASLLPDAYSTAPDGGCPSTGRVRRPSETRQPTNSSTGRDREYVQPKIVDHCDVVADSLIQSSSILSMEEQSSGHLRCGRSLSGEGSMSPMRRTMPAKMRASLSGERGLLDNSSIADPSASRVLRRMSVDCTNSVSAANGGAGESSLLSSVTNGKLRRQSSFGNEPAGSAATGPFGWMPGNSTLTSGPAHAADADESGYGDSKRPLESTPSEESREERIARYKEQRRRSKQAHSFMCGTNDEREISGSATKQWHSLEDEQQQQQQPLRRGSAVFFDPRQPSSSDAVRSTSISSSFSDSTASDMSNVGVSTRRRESVPHPADGSSVASPPLRKPELTQPGVPYDASESAAADSAKTVTPQDALSQLSPSIVSHCHSQPAGISDAQVSDTTCVASAATMNPRRHSARRRRSNLLADAEQAEAAPALLEVPGESESGDAGAESVSVVTRPRRRRTTAEKSEGAESGGTREITRDSGNQALWQQWQQLTSPRGAASPLLTEAAAPATAAASNPERNIGKSGGATASVSSAERGSAEHPEPHGVRSEKADRRRAPGSGDAPELPSDDAVQVAKPSAPRPASPATTRRAEEDELRSGSAAAESQRATSAASTSKPAPLLGSGGLRLDATVVESATSTTCDNQAVESETKANPTGCSLLGATTAAVPAGSDTSGVGSATAPAQNKQRSEKKNAALGLILQKFEAANNVLPPALAAAIGLPSPTSSSADSLQPKPTSLVKTGKVESTIKQIATGQQPAEPSSIPHATEKAATHAAHAAASVGSLVRKFAGAVSPPTSLHLSLLSSTDGSDAATTASKSSASPVHPASPAAGIVGDAAGGSRQPQQRADGGGSSSSSSRPPSPKVGGWPPVSIGARSGHSSPGSARRSPVSAASPAAFAQASNVTDSDASSQLTDDGQHSDVVSGRRHAGVPTMKQHLQSPEKLPTQQLPYFSAIGKKPPKAVPTPVAPAVTSAEAADEPARADGRLLLAAGRHEEDLSVQCNANSAVSSLEPAEANVSVDAERRQLLPRNGGAKRMQTEAINSVHEASSAVLDSPDDELAAAVAAEEAPADAQRRSLAGDLRSTNASQQQLPPQTFAKLRAVPPSAPSKPSASAKSEPSQPLLDPQLATILQARLKKVETKGLATAAVTRPSSSSAALQTHDEQQHGKSAGRDDAVDRSAHSIKDRAQYFMQMQQKALGATDASPPVGARPSGQGILTKQPSFSTEHTRNDSTLGVNSHPTAAHNSDAGRQEPSTDFRPPQSGNLAVDPAIAAADSTVQQAERSHQKSSKKERRRDRRRRGSLHGGKECDRWQTQPVTDNEVLVAAAVVVRGQPNSVVLAADGIMQPDGSGLHASAAVGVAGVAGAIATQPNGFGVGDDVDEVRRLAVMTLEEKIGLFMDRSVAWSNCTDAEAAAVSPDRSIRRLPKGEVATSRRYRRCAWLGRFSTQPVSPAEVHRALRALGSSALAPPAELSAELNAKIEQLCLQLAEHRHADKQGAAAVVSQRQDKTGRPVVRRSAGSGKKASGAPDSNISLHLNGSNETHAQHVRTKTETGRRAVSAAQRKGAARPTSLIADPPSSSLLHAEQNGGSPEVYHTNSEGISRGSALRQSQRAPAMRSKTSEKPAKARPVSMNFDLSVHANSAATHGAASPETDPARGTASVKSAVSRQRPHSAKAAVTTQGRVRNDDAAKSNGVAAVPSTPSDARRTSTNKGDEKKEKISHPETASRGGAERTGAPHEVSSASEHLTWADKSKSQPCISTMEDDGADGDLPSYMRATSSYARKVEHLLMESDDEEENSNARLAPDSDRSPLDASRHDPGSRTTFQRAVASAADGGTTRASVRRTLGSRLSVGTPLESPTSGHSSDLPSYMRATKAVSMRDIRSPAGKPSPTTEEPTSTAVGVRAKRRSVDGSRNSLPPPRPASVTTGDQSASGESDRGDDDEDEELPSYMRATKSFARKVEHLIESCDEDDEDAVATTRRDECSDAGDRASSSRRSPAPRRSRTPSTHGGSDLTPSEPYAPPTRDTSKQLDSDGGNDRSQRRKPQRPATSKNASSTSLHTDGSAAQHEYVPELSSPDAVHTPSFGRTAEVVAPIVDGRKRKAKTSETLTQNSVLAEVNGNHKAETMTAHGKSQHQGKDKHALLGGDLPSFMRATKSSSTKDRHRPGSMTLPEHPSSDVVKSTKAPPTESIGKHHVKGQGSRESLCSTGANSSRAESGHHSSSESAEHSHVAPIPLAPVSNFHSTTTTSKSRKSSSSRTSANMGVVPRHTKLPIGAAGGAVG